MFCKRDEAIWRLMCGFIAGLDNCVQMLSGGPQVF